MRKVYYSKEVANDFKNTTGMLKRDFKVLTVTSTSYGYTAEILEKNTDKKKLCSIKLITILYTVKILKSIYKNNIKRC